LLIQVSSFRFQVLIYGFRFQLLFVSIVMKPYLIQGGQHVDARGCVSFVNDFDFKGVDRFYWVQVGPTNVQRGWVGHQREYKWFTVISGQVLVAVVRPDQWQCPSRDLPVA
jgi:dTDP-4-dehydrorhamnose 3,5-epimerase